MNMIKFKRVFSAHLEFLLSFPRYNNVKITFNYSSLCVSAPAQLLHLNVFYSMLPKSEPLIILNKLLNVNSPLLETLLNSLRRYMSWFMLLSLHSPL